MPKYFNAVYFAEYFLNILKNIRLNCYTEFEEDQQLDTMIYEKPSTKLTTLYFYVNCHCLTGTNLDLYFSYS